MDFTLELEQIYRMLSPVSEIAGMNNVPSTSSVDIIRKILQSNANGVLSIDRLVEEFKGAPGGADKNKYATIYSANNIDNIDHAYFVDNATKLTFNKVVDVSDNRRFCVIMVHEPRITPQTDNSQPVETFLNFMPPTVVSMCNPYLNVEFVFKRSGAEGNQYLQTPSTLKFLLGGAKQSSLDESTKIIAEADIMAAKGKEPQSSFAGMELFTAPQALQNYATTADRYLQPLDMFRPLATLESITISSRGTKDIMSYKTAQLQMKIHDKTRLAEFADILQPLSAPNTSVWLEYGWNYPLNVGSPYGEFINEHIRTREAYGLINSTYTFDAAGQVSVTVQLSAKGAIGLHNVTLNASNDAFSTNMKNWLELSQNISKWKKSQLGTTDISDDRKDLLGYVLINAAAEYTFPDLDTNEIRKALKELDDALKKTYKNDEEIAKLIEDLDAYYKSDGKNLAYFEKVKSTANTIVENKFKELTGKNDPFLVSNNDKLVQIIGQRTSEKGARYKNCLQQIEEFKKTNRGTSVVSFGKIITTMLCPALDTLKEEIDEFELFFYDINDRAGYASSINLAEFPIDVELLKNRYQQHLETVATETITIEQFIKLVVDSQISDFRAIPYGFRNTTGIVNLGGKNSSDAPGTLTQRGATQYPLLSLKYNDNRGEFVLPQIEILLETKQSRDDVDNKIKNILRIHVFDKALNPYPNSQIQIQEAAPWTRQEINNEVSKNVPVLVPGLNSSAIFETSISTKNNAQLQTSQMLRMNSGKNVQATPRGSGIGGLPLVVTPVTLTMRTLGCPAISYGQLFFVDMNTGTTIDNRYGVVGLTHEIKPGSFFTTLQLGLYDSYAKFVVVEPFTVKPT